MIRLRRLLCAIGWHRWHNGPSWVTAGRRHLRRGHAILRGKECIHCPKRIIVLASFYPPLPGDPVSRAADAWAARRK